ncbi:hypothetical protein ABFS83_13G183700 [Erythranthe nasuta]
MAIPFSLSLLLVALLTTATTLRPTSATETTPPPQPPPPPPVSTAQTPPPPATPTEIPQNQLDNIFDALISAGDFAGWANLISSTDSSSLPLTATIFIPSHDGIPSSPLSTANTITGMRLNPFLMAYHIVPHRLTFSDLQQFGTHTRLPTLLPDKYIVITNNSPTNFTVDDSQIVQADVFVNAAFTVHGIQKVLDYTLYAGNSILPPPPEDPTKKDPIFPGDITIGLSSDASCSFSCVSTSLLTICAAVLAIKILLNGTKGY